MKIKKCHLIEYEYNEDNIILNKKIYVLNENNEYQSKIIFSSYFKHLYNDKKYNIIKCSEINLIPNKIITYISRYGKQSN